jgi:hypothetical protein
MWLWLLLRLLLRAGCLWIEMVMALLQWDRRRTHCLGFDGRQHSLFFLAGDLVMLSGFYWRESRPVVGDLVARLPSTFVILSIEQAAVRFFYAANMSRGQ